MHRFMSSVASSSSGRAEQPAAASSSSNSAEQPIASLRSAEQPATPSHLKILSIRDVQRWLADEPIASCSSADVQRIREAAAVLSHPKPRKDDVRPLQSKWQVTQIKNLPQSSWLPHSRSFSMKRSKKPNLWQLKLQSAMGCCLD
jgi:hypothetical protein